MGHYMFNEICAGFFHSSSRRSPHDIMCNIEVWKADNTVDKGRTMSIDKIGPRR